MSSLTATRQQTTNPIHTLVKDLGSPRSNKRETAAKSLEEMLKKDANATIIMLANAVDGGISNSEVRSKLSNALRSYAIMPRRVSEVLDWVTSSTLPLAGRQDYQIITEFKKLSQTDRNNRREVLLGWSSLVGRCNLELDVSIEDINCQLDDLEHFDLLKEKISRLEKIFNGSLAYREADIDTGLKKLKKRPSFANATRLDFYHSRITDAGLSELKTLKRLTELGLSYTPITDEGIKNLKSIRTLQELDLSGTKITDSGLRELKNLPKLTALNLSYTEITNKGLKELKNLKRLTSLDLSNTDITNKGLKELSGFTKLTTLILINTGISYARLSVLKNLGGLTELYVSQRTVLT